LFNPDASARKLPRVPGHGSFEIEFRKMGYLMMANEFDALNQNFLQRSRSYEVNWRLRSAEAGVRAAEADKYF
jgi:hypothetical protein